MYLTKVSLLERTSNSVAMTGLHRDRARCASGVTGDDAAVAQALNNAMTAGNFAADDVNLVSLLNEHFGQNSGGCYLLHCTLHNC